MNKEYTENLIIRLCAQPRTLDYIAQNLNGVDPITVNDVLKELEQDNKLRCQDDLWLIEENAKKEISDIINPDPELYLKKVYGSF